MKISLPEECLTLPEGTKSKLITVLSRFSAINWFNGLRTFRDTEQRAEELVKTHLSRLLKDEKRASEFQVQWIEGDWALADTLEKKRDREFYKLWNEEGANVYNIAKKNGRLAAHDAIRSKLAEIISLPNNPNRDNRMDAYEGIQAMANHLSYIVVEDLVDTPNVNEPLVELYLMGLWPLGAIPFTPKTVIQSILESIKIDILNNPYFISIIEDNLPSEWESVDQMIAGVLEYLNLDDPILRTSLKKKFPKGKLSNRFFLFTARKSSKIIDSDLRKESRENLANQYMWRQEPSFYRIIEEVKKVDKDEFHAILKLHEVFLNSHGLEGRCANFRSRNISGCSLPNLDLSYADLSYAILDGSMMPYSKFINANFEHASLIDVEMSDSNMTYANLNYADLSHSIIKGVVFRDNDFIDTCFKYCLLENTSFVDCDLSRAIGLDEVYFEGTSFIDIETIVNSKANIPTEFLRKCNIPDYIIESVRKKAVEAKGSIVFVSYKHESPEHKEWVKLLARRLLDNGIYAYLDQWELKAGDSLGHYMEQGIGNSRHAIFVCSDDAVSSANERRGWIGYETDLLVSLGVENQITTIPILRGTKKVPVFLKGKFYLDFNSDDENIRDEPFNELVHTILGHSSRPVIETPIEPDQPAR